MDERLSSYGLIARASIEFSIPFLTKVFLERFAQLHQVKDSYAYLADVSGSIITCLSVKNWVYC